MKTINRYTQMNDGWLKLVSLIVIHFLFLSSISLTDAAVAMQGAAAEPSSAQAKSTEPLSSPSSTDGTVVVSGKQSFENQLLMRELLLLRTNLSVKEHLSISDVQAEQLQQIEKTYQRKIGELGRASLKITERAQKLQSMFSEIEKSLLNQFSPEQRKRLRQVAVQSFGSVPGKDDSLPVFNLLANPEFRSYLEINSISPEPLQQKLREEYLKLQRDLAELKNRSNETVLSSLSDDEKARLKDMLGEPFPFEKAPDAKTVKK